ESRPTSRGGPRTRAPGATTPMEQESGRSRPRFSPGPRLGGQMENRPRELVRVVPDLRAFPQHVAGPGPAPKGAQGLRLRLGRVRLLRGVALREGLGDARDV